MKTVTALSVAVIGVSLLTIGAALAKDDRTEMRGMGNQTQSMWLTKDEVARRIQSRGYGRIREIEREGRLYEVEVTHPKRGRLELRVDPVTGDIVGEKRDD